jgi:ABC-type multidrug transport system ATPase subunit
MIDVEGLTKVYPRSPTNGARAIDGVTFHVPDRSVFGLLGPNGAGKTTTVRILAAILEPTSGTASVAGYDVVSERHAVQASMGYMPANPGLYPALTAEEHLDYWGRFHRMPKADRAGRSAALLDFVGLASEGRTKAKDYIPEMIKRLSLAQALLHDPDLLVLDEPLDGLDADGVLAFRTLFQQLHRDGKTIFLSSHILADVVQTCDRIAVIADGQIATEATLDELQDRIGTRGALRALVETGEVSSPAMRALQGLDHVIEVARTNWGVVVTMDSDARTEVNRILVAQGVRVTGLKLAEITLEDAFASLTGGPELDA